MTSTRGETSLIADRSRAALYPVTLCTPLGVIRRCGHFHRLSKVSDQLVARMRSNASKRVVARAAGSCNIRGNRNREGQWFYHVPGMPYDEGALSNAGHRKG